MKVCGSLLHHGTLSLEETVRFSELDRSNVKKCLLVLIQHNCVQAFSSPVKVGGGGALKTITQYMAILDNIIHRLRFAKFLAIVAKNLDAKCEALLEGLLQHGRLTFDQLMGRATSNRSEANRDALRESFNKLVHAHYVERCPRAEPFISPCDDGVSSRKHKSAVQPLSLEQQAMIAAALSDSERFSGISDRGQDSTEDGKAVAYDPSVSVGDKRKHEELEDDNDVQAMIAENEVLWRANFEMFVHYFKKKVGHLREMTNKINNAELKLFLEVELGPDLHPLPRPDKTKEDILLFFKLYDPDKEELRYVGQLFVKALGKPSEIISKLNEMAGFLQNEDIDLYEEIKYEPNVMCEPIDKKLTFRSSQACVDNISTRLSPDAGNVLEAMIESNREQSSKDKNSVLASMDAILEGVRVKGITVELVRVILEQLGCRLCTEETGALYTIDLNGIIETCKNEEVEDLVLKKYGKEAYRIFRLLAKEGRYYETDQVADITFVEKKESLGILYRLWKDNYLEMQNLQLNGAGPSQCFLWAVKRDELLEHVLNDMYHAALNLSQRAAYMIEQEPEILGPKQMLPEQQRKEKTVQHKKWMILQSSLSKIDEAIMLFHDF